MKVKHNNKATILQQPRLQQYYFCWVKIYLLPEKKKKKAYMSMSNEMEMRRRGSGRQPAKLTIKLCCLYVPRIIKMTILIKTNIVSASSLDEFEAP